METNTPTKIDNIKTLYKQVNVKKNFIIRCAEHFGKKPLSLRAHWFGNFWAIPQKDQDEVVKLLQNYINNQ